MADNASTNQITFRNRQYGDLHFSGGDDAMSISIDENAVHDVDQLPDAEEVLRSGDEESISEGSDEDKDEDGFETDVHSVPPSTRLVTIETEALVSTPAHVKSEPTAKRTDSEPAVEQSVSGNNDTNADENGMVARNDWPPATPNNTLYQTENNADDVVREGMCTQPAHPERTRK